MDRYAGGKRQGVVEAGQPREAGSKPKTTVFLEASATRSALAGTGEPLVAGFSGSLDLHFDTRDRGTPHLEARLGTPPPLLMCATGISCMCGLEADETARCAACLLARAPKITYI